MITRTLQLLAIVSVLLNQEIIANDEHDRQLLRVRAYGANPNFKLSRCEGMVKERNKLDRTKTHTLTWVLASDQVIVIAIVIVSMEWFVFREGPIVQFLVAQVAEEMDLDRTTGRFRIRWSFNDKASIFLNHIHCSIRRSDLGGGGGSNPAPTPPAPTPIANNNGSYPRIKWSTNFPLGLCQGDCDRDSDCKV